MLRLVSKCSATLASVVLFHPWSATGFRRSKVPATPLADGSATPPPLKSQDKCYREVWDGARQGHFNTLEAAERAVATPWSAIGAV